MGGVIIIEEIANATDAYLERSLRDLACSPYNYLHYATISLDIQWFGRREAFTTAASIDRGYGPSLCTNREIAMIDLSSVNDLALRKLLAGLFPKVPLSPLGVA